MFSYTTKNVNVISLIVSIFIFILINQGFLFLNQKNFTNSISNVSQEEKNETVKQMENTINNVVKEKEDNKKVLKKNSKIVWKLEIPAISLSAEIMEGTTSDIMNKYIGHFTNTSKTNGNIGLAAHNRGYPVNYFKDIKKLKIGDKIIYQYNKYKKTYLVNKVQIIKDTDWSKLESTEENMITLITCVENEPLYRRCIQGIEE